MSRRIVQYIAFTDDFDKKSIAEETVELAIDGMVYEVDCLASKAAELREFLTEWRGAAHEQWRMPSKPGKGGKRERITAQGPKPLEIMATPRPAAMARPKNAVIGDMARDRTARTQIREWCNANGHPCARIGKIPVEGLREYMEQNPDSYVPETTVIDAGLRELPNAV